MALEGPGTVVASYDYCPTGNEADIAGGTNPVTAVGLGNPLRQGAVPYDDGTKDFFGPDGAIIEDYNGTGIQDPALTYDDVMPGVAVGAAPGRSGDRDSGSPRLAAPTAARFAASAPPAPPTSSTIRPWARSGPEPTPRHRWRRTTARPPA